MSFGAEFDNFIMVNPFNFLYSKTKLNCLDVVGAGTAALLWLQRRFFCLRSCRFLISIIIIVIVIVVCCLSSPSFQYFPAFVVHQITAQFCRLRDTYEDP